MKSLHYYKLLVFALSFLATDVWGAGFGDIPASLAMPAGTSVQRNVSNTLFEAVNIYQKVTFAPEGRGIVLSSGTKLPGVKISPGGTLVKWTMECTPSGSVSVDLLRSADGAGVPVLTMVGSGTKPAISSNTEAKGTITDWTNSMVLNTNDNLVVTLSGITNVTSVTIVFYWQ